MFTPIVSTPLFPAFDGFCSCVTLLAYWSFALRTDRPLLSLSRRRRRIKTYGAPIDETDATAIKEYLKKNFGS
jgi:hypothetical protein